MGEKSVVFLSRTSKQLHECMQLHTAIYRKINVDDSIFSDADRHYRKGKVITLQQLCDKYEQVTNKTIRCIGSFEYIWGGAY